MVDTKKLMKHYNETLIRYYKASVYLDDNSNTIEEREKWIPEFKKIMTTLDKILKLLIANGIRFEEHEVTGGFNY